MAARRWLRGAAVLVAAAAATGAVAPTAAQAGSPPPAPLADLSVQVSFAPSSVTSGDDVTFTIAAANAGPDTAADVVVGIAARYPLSLEGAPPAGCRRGADYESIICEVGDLAAGASTSVELTMRANASGLYTIPVAAASDTADPDTDDRVATAVVLVRRGPSQAERYISGIFPTILERPVDPASLAYWSQRWKERYFGFPRTAITVPTAIIRSDEHRRLRIRESYQRILGRAVDAPSLAYWVGRARSGVTFERIEQLLMGSGEFARKSSADRIGATYQAVLGRAPSSGERTRWNAAFGATGNLGILAALLQRTTEGYDVVISDKFEATFGTGPNAFARYVWQVGLRNGQTPEQLWAQLLVSNDVLRLYPFTDDDYLELEGGEYRSIDLSDETPELVASIEAD